MNEYVDNEARKAKLVGKTGQSMEHARWKNLSRNKNPCLIQKGKTKHNRKKCQTNAVAYLG